MLKHLKINTKIIASLTVTLAVFMSPVAAYAADPCANTTNGGNSVSQAKLKTCVTQSPIVKDIQSIVNFLSIGVGMVVIAMIILGGIQYSIAGDSPEATTKAKSRITNALIALFAYLFIFAFIQWIIPGGLFG